MHASQADDKVDGVTRALTPTALALAFVTSCATPATSTASVVSAPSPAPAPALTPPAPAMRAPTDRGKYDELVAKAEAGDDVDFLELRLAYLKSAAFQSAMQRRDEVHELRRKMFAAMQAGGNPQAVLDVAQQTLAIVWIDLEAQKARRQACHLLKDEECAARGRRIELGLLKSITESGDGKTCKSAWTVISVDEEYFILHMAGMKLERQALTRGDGGACDAMHTVDEAGEEHTFFFDVGELLRAG